MDVLGPHIPKHDAKKDPISFQKLSKNLVQNRLQMQVETLEHLQRVFNKMYGQIRTNKMSAEAYRKNI